MSPALLGRVGDGGEVGEVGVRDQPSMAGKQQEIEMPKQKTKRAAMKRFKTTGTGKLKRWHANHSHILTKKTRKRKNGLKKGDLVSSADFPRVSRLLQA
jgi:large subunit ribosomal protein L35